MAHAGYPFGQAQRYQSIETLSFLAVKYLKRIHFIYNRVFFIPKRITSTIRLCDHKYERIGYASLCAIMLYHRLSHYIQAPTHLFFRPYTLPLSIAAHPLVYTRPIQSYSPILSYSYLYPIGYTAGEYGQLTYPLPILDPDFKPTESPNGFLGRVTCKNRLTPKTYPLYIRPILSCHLYPLVQFFISFIVLEYLLGILQLPSCDPSLVGTISPQRQSQTLFDIFDLPRFLVNFLFEMRPP